jgi:hypothetical protein
LVFLSSIPDDEDSPERKLKAVACVEGVEEPCDGIEVIGRSIKVSDRDSQVEHFMHHASLEKILEELIVDYTPPGLHLDNEALGLVIGIGVEGLLKPAVQPEQHRYPNPIVRSFPRLDAKPDRQKLRRDLRQDFVTLQLP